MRVKDSERLSYLLWDTKTFSHHSMTMFTNIYCDDISESTVVWFCEHSVALEADCYQANKSD